MKKSTKVIICAVIPPALITAIFILTGVTEIIFQSGEGAFCFEILLCIVSLVFLLRLDKKYLTQDDELICITSYFISAAAVLLLAPFFVRIYENSELYRTLNPWDEAGAWTGAQWYFYILPVVGKTVLFFIIRTVSSCIRALKNYAKGK